MGDEVHAYFTLEGDWVVRDVFHDLIHLVDDTYPISPDRKVGQQITFCADCKGMVWKGCRVDASIFKRAALQASNVCQENVRVKVHHFKYGKRCNGKTFTGVIPDDPTPVIVSSKAAG